MDQANALKSSPVRKLAIRKIEQDKTVSEARGKSNDDERGWVEEEEEGVEMEVILSRWEGSRDGLDGEDFDWEWVHERRKMELREVARPIHSRDEGEGPDVGETKPEGLNLVRRTLLLMMRYTDQAEYRKASDSKGP